MKSNQLDLKSPQIRSFISFLLALIKHSSQLLVTWLPSFGALNRIGAIKNLIHWWGDQRRLTGGFLGTSLALRKGSRVKLTEGGPMETVFAVAWVMIGFLALLERTAD